LIGEGKASPSPDQLDGFTPELGRVWRLGAWHRLLLAGTIEVDLGFEHPGEGRGDRDRAAGVLLAVVGLGALG